MLCNNAYLNVSSSSDITATIVQLNSTIGKEELTEAIDHHALFNPRGYGYLGSCSDSADAVAAYDWLGHAIGTDATGSARRPGFCE